MTKKTIVVTFELEYHDGSFPDDGSEVATYLATITQPLKNADSALWFLSNPKVFIEAPRVIVGMDGGINQGASSEIPIEVVTADYDGGVEDTIEISQPGSGTTSAWVYSCMANYDPDWVEDVYRDYMDHGEAVPGTE